MTTVKNILDALFATAPREFELEGDNNGLMIGNPDNFVTKVLFCLDLTTVMAEKAKNEGFDLIVTHHPFIFRPISAVTSENYKGRIIMSLSKSNISVISMHTNADAADGGVNDKLAEKIGLQNIRKGEKTGEEFENILRLGELPSECTGKELCEILKKKIFPAPLRGHIADKMIKTVAVCGGAGEDALSYATENGADAYVTSDIRNHVIIEAAERGVTMIDAGHYQTEIFGLEFMRDVVEKNFNVKTEICDEIRNIYIGEN